jgi:transposase-like protein
VSIKALARKHGVAQATMWKAIHGLSYKEVQP